MKGSRSPRQEQCSNPANNVTRINSNKQSHQNKKREYVNEGQEEKEDDDDDGDMMRRRNRCRKRKC